MKIIIYLHPSTAVFSFEGIGLVRLPNLTRLILTRL